MPNLSNKIQAVPTNIITGFLGVGKTSAILHLLKSKPDDQRWAILVNEFGKVGIDGALFKSHDSSPESIFIREVPGGCMCCTSGLPMQIALNQLLMRAKPDRLLIEPTGLGHPIEVMQVLSSEHYADVLSIEKIMTLVDARKLSDKRYTSHDIFNQQIAIADVVVGNKEDLYQANDKAQLVRYIKANASDKTEIMFAQHGQLTLDALTGPTRLSVSPKSGGHLNSSHQSSAKQDFSDLPIPKIGYMKAINQGESFTSAGWRFESSRVFCKSQLVLFFQSLSVERMKAVFITQAGVYGYNLTSDELTEITLDDALESRIEIIADEIDQEWEAQLLACLVPDEHSNLGQSSLA